MAEVTFTETVRFVVRACITKCCGIHFGVPAKWDEERRKDRSDFYCLNGHPQHYVGKTEAEIEREKRVAAETNASFWQGRAREQEKETERLRKRVGNGVCPCCSRTFKQLVRHMKAKHPDYVPAPTVAPMHEKINAKEGAK